MSPSARLLTAIAVTLVVSAAACAAENPSAGSWGPAPLKGATGGLWLTEWDLGVLKGWGANSVRPMLLKPDLVEADGEVTLSEEYFGRIDDFVERCRRVGLRVVLDLHAHGLFFPDENWRPEAQAAWDDAGRRRRLASLWRSIARRYQAEREVIAGFDLLNEPHPPYTDAGDAAWNAIAREVTEAIREVDTHHTVVVECAHYANPFGMATLTPTGDRNTVYSFHMYMPHEFTEQGTRPEWPFGQVYPGTIPLGWDDKTPTPVDRGWLEEALQPAVDFQKQHDARLWIGEFSARRDSPEASALHYLRDVLDLFDRHGWDWCYHAFRESPIWSLEHCGDPNCGERHQTTPRLELLRERWQQ